MQQATRFFRFTIMLNLLNQLAAWDHSISGWLAIQPGEETFYPIRFWLAQIGAHVGDAWVWIALVLWLFWRASQELEPERNRRYWLAIGLGLSIGIAAFVSSILKVSLDRVRPPDAGVIYLGILDPYSFPSGHALRMGAVATWGGKLFPQWLGWALMVWVGWSRVTIGVHYAGDVLAGWLIGLLIGWSVRWVVARCGQDEGMKG